MDIRKIAISTGLILVLAVGTTQAFFTDDDFFANPPSPTLLIEKPRVGWDAERMIVKFHFVNELQQLSVSLLEEGMEQEQVQYQCNGQVVKIIGFQRAIRLSSSDGTLFWFVYRKENFRLDKEHRVVFEGRFRGGSGTFVFVYKVVKAENDIIMEAVDR